MLSTCSLTRASPLACSPRENQTLEPKKPPLATVKLAIVSVDSGTSRPRLELRLAVLLFPTEGVGTGQPKSTPSSSSPSDPVTAR